MGVSRCLSFSLSLWQRETGSPCGSAPHAYWGLGVWGMGYGVGVLGIGVWVGDRRVPGEY